MEGLMIGMMTGGIVGIAVSKTLIDMIRMYVNAIRKD